jgi:hypothetical protein
LYSVAETWKNLGAINGLEILRVTKEGAENLGIGVEEIEDVLAILHIEAAPLLQTLYIIGPVSPLNGITNNN